MRLLIKTFFLLLLSPAIWSADDREDNASKHTPVDKTWVYISPEKVKNEEILKIGRIYKFLPSAITDNLNYSGTFEIISSPEQALPENASFFLEIIPISAAPKKRNEMRKEKVWKERYDGLKESKATVYKRKMFRYNVFTCKYKLYVSKNGKWKSEKSGKVTFISDTLCHMIDFFSGLIYKEMVKVKVNKVSMSKDGANLIVSGKITNLSNFSMSDISISTAYKAHDALNYYKKYKIDSGTLKPNEQKAFNINIKNIFTKHPKKCKKIWQNAHVVVAELSLNSK